MAKVTIINNSQKPIVVAGVSVLPTQTAEVEDSVLELPVVAALVKKKFLTKYTAKKTAKTTGKTDGKTTDKTDDTAKTDSKTE